jgi:NADPH-dependent curcumin reductase CurA
MNYQNRQWFYVKRPEGRVGDEHYELRESELDDKLSSNEVLIRARIVSVDPYIRIQQHERNTYDVPHPLGIVQRAGVVGEVVASASPLFKQGDWVSAYSGWQLYAKCHYTAWFGLMEAGKPRPGDTLVVSGAAGAVGSLVAQFGKRAGCRVIGIAGGPDKCAFLTDTLKLDGAVDYRAHPTREGLQSALQAATGGVDVYFDNVGGMVTDAVIPLIKRRARIVICGAIAQYDGGLDTPDLAPRFLQHMLFQRATIQGILARDFTHRMDEMLQTVAPWVKNGEIVYQETYVDGFEALPNALNSLFEGKNLGKLLVRV